MEYFLNVDRSPLYFPYKNCNFIIEYMAIVTQFSLFVLLKTTVNFAEDANNELDHQIRKKPSFLQNFKVRKQCH
jgi:hypothetical protein